MVVVIPPVSARVAAVEAGPIVQVHDRGGDPPPAESAPTEGDRPRGPGDATPRHPAIPGGARPNRGDPASTLPPAVVTALRQQFGAQVDRLPPAELAAFARAYNDFTRTGSDRRDLGPFLQAFGRALVVDRRRMVGEMAGNPDAHLTRLAPAIERQAGLMRISESADYVRTQGDRAFELMRNRVLTTASTSEAARAFTREQLATPEGWQAFRRLYLQAAGGDFAFQRMAFNRNPRHPDYVVARFAASMDVLHEPGANGTTALQAGTPEHIALAATRRLVELGREHPQLQAFTADQVRSMADHLRAPGTRHRFTMVAGDPPRLDHDVISPASGAAPSRETALAVFREGARTTLAGLTAAEEKLRNNTMSAGDLLPLAHQVQDHLVAELVRNPDEPNTGLLPRILDLRDQIRGTEAQVAQERAREGYVRLGTAAVGIVSGVGLLLSGPAGWGVGITAALAAGAGTSAVASMALDTADYTQRLRAGGLNHAGLVLGDLERESGLGLGASYVLNTAGAVAGLPTIAAAARLRYARDLVSALRTEGDAAQRTSSVVGFLEANKVMTREAWAALSPERQQTAFRLIERFGSEMSPQALQAVLRFGAVEAEVNNAAGAVANVDHIYAAYSEMNVAEAARRGRPLTERERVINAIATVGTDAQGKFGHQALDIIPTLANGGVARTSQEYLRAVRERAVRDAFAGLEHASGADPRALAAWRDRYLSRVAAEADPARRNQELAAIARDLQADPQSAAWINRHFTQTDHAIRMQGFVEGAYVHNVVDPGRIYAMGRTAGLSEADAAEAAYRATMHGFGNAFVATAYPGMPQFASVMRPGTTTALFSPEQLRNLERVGRASLHYNQELQPSVAQAARWGIATDPPPRGVRQVYAAALRANGGRLPPGLQEWLFDTGQALRQARADAGLGAGATNADNLGNYVPEGMRKWAGIFSANDFTPPAQRTVGDQVERLLGGMNAYSIEEFSVGNVARFDSNFAGPAARLGLTRSPTSATYDWIMRRNASGVFEVASGADPAAVSRAAQAIRARHKDLVGSDADVLRAFYNRPQAGDMQTALAAIAEGQLPAAFNMQAALRNAQLDRNVSVITQLLLYQQAIAQGVRTFDAR